MESARIQQLEKLVKEYGAPLYIYDGNVIKNQYHRLIRALKKVENVKVNYACKANTNLNILKYFKKIGAGLDTVSIQEVQLGLMAGFEPKEIIYTPNGVSLEEIKQAVELGVHVNIDNLTLLEHFGQEIKNYPVGIRINPHIMAGGNKKISVGHIDSKFGISIYQLPHILSVVKNTGLKIDGIHMHTGSDILDVEVFLQGAEILFDTAKNFENLEYLDFGSGFKVPYKEGDNETDIKYLGEKLTERFLEFEKEYYKKVTLVFEPGKFLVSQSGFFLAAVNSIKQTTSTVFAEVDSGFNHLIRPMFYDSYHNITNISNPKGRERFYTVVGYICETDTFGTNRKLHEVHEGDILCFENAGAYCFSMSSNYNSRLKPSEILLLNDKSLLIRRREKLEDLLTTTEEITI
ncbi:MAG: diaminopimelate decarboxylase [Flavobacteriaceae bacterium]|jgi:diaminopimelate decarboxylase|nr:diaminopimelate decarboxylase [Flavobacteriaceae bacterium]